MSKEKKKYLNQKILQKQTIFASGTIPLECQINFSKLIVPVRSTSCKSLDCIFNLESLAFKFQESPDAQRYGSEKCMICGESIQLNSIYIDEDMEKVLEVLSSTLSEIEFDSLVAGASDLKLTVDKYNRFTLNDNENNVVKLIKQSETQAEYADNYPTFNSKQNPEFYINGYVFVHQNIEKYAADKLQAYLGLFFPSLLDPKSRWKELFVYEDKNTEKMTFFNEWMSLCKVYHRDKKKHFIMASGGIGYPRQEEYEDRTFLVPIFQDDPDHDIKQEPNNKVNMERCDPMNSPRVFHSLIQHGDYVYALGGDRRDFVNKIDVAIKSCERFDLKKSKWEMIPSMSKPRSLFSTLVYGDNIYVIGGKVMNHTTRNTEDELSVEIYNPTAKHWMIYKINPTGQNPCYFTERPYCFVRSNHTIVIFGGRKGNSYNSVCERSRQCTELDIQTGQYSFKNHYLPEKGLPFDFQSDFQGICYNNRYIFGFKNMKQERGKYYLTPSIYKYYEQSEDKEKFLEEKTKEIKY